MASRPHIYQVAPAAPPNESAANTETVIATLSGVLSEFPNQTVSLIAFVAVTPGAAATAMQVRLRRSTIAGAIVGNNAANAGDIVAAKLSTIPLVASEQRVGDFADSYVLTIQGTGEGGAATVSAASIVAIVS